MKSEQIQETLNRVFHEKKKRIVFWYDAEKEFEDMLETIRIDDVTILRLDEHGALSLKIRLEMEDPDGKIHPLCTLWRTAAARGLAP